MSSQPLWLELPPISASAPKRLIVFLPGAGSNPESFAPVAIAWMLKFPGATGAIMQALRPSQAGRGSDWFDARGPVDEVAPRVKTAGQELARRIEALQQSTEQSGSATVLVGFSQGATVALEVARSRPDLLAIAVSYSGRMIPPPRSGETITPTIHLLHGASDSLVPVAHSQRAHQRLSAIGTRTTLDIVEDHGHSIGQNMIILGTTRVMQTLFRKRQPARPAGGRPAGGSTTLH